MGSGMGLGARSARMRLCNGPLCLQNVSLALVINIASYHKPERRSWGWH